MGTPAFMEFVESIQSEGVTFNQEFKDLTELKPESFGNAKLAIKPFTPEETREIVFKTMLDAEVDHTMRLDGTGPGDYRSVVAFFARQLLKDLCLVGSYDQLYSKVKTFIRDHLFTSAVDLEDPVILRNLSEPEVGKVVFDRFREAINTLTIYEGGGSRIGGHIRLRDTRPFRTESRGFVQAKKSVFNRIVSETKRREELDLPQKMARLRQWCTDASESGESEGTPEYRFMYVDQAGFEQHQPKNFAALAASFVEYQEVA